MRVEVAIACALLAAATAAADPVFQNLTGPLDHRYTGGWEHFVGGGVAVLDCDGDLYPDMYVAGGAGMAELLRNRSAGPGGELEFERDTPEALALENVTGAYPLDIDGDAILDLAVLRVGANMLLRGRGDCLFEPFTDLGFSAPPDDWTTAFSATWERGRERPTLAFGNYVDRADPEGPFQACDDNLLYRPAGRKYADPIPLRPGHCALSMLFSDWGRRGRADLRVSNDRHYYVRDGEEQLWAMEPEPRLYTRAEGWNRFMLWGMGIASRDIDGDGLPEVFLSSMGDQKLHSLSPGAKGPSYQDATYERGTTAHRPYIGDDGRPSTGWQVSFGDVDNDGLDDIFIAKGNVEQMPGSAMKDPNNLLRQRPDGSFEEIGDAAGIASMHRARGGALVDLDLDGRLDLVVVNRNAPLGIFRNTGPAEGHWLQVALRQDGPNRLAIGAWIELRRGDRVIAREIIVGGGHASGRAGFEHFGLGEHTDLELRVIWPDGAVSRWHPVEADRIVTLERAGNDAMPVYH